MAWSSLTHHSWPLWKSAGLAGQSLLVLWSGGADSTALVSLAREFRGPLKFTLTLGHCHHGPGPEAAARDEARRFCQQKALEWKLPLLIAESPTELSGEESLRDFRRAQALRWQEELGFDRLLLAHQAEDLVETRFFRLLRGTGLEGLESMRAEDLPWWRPLLEFSRTDLRAHLEWEGLSHVEDPSNQETRYRRNWLRNEIFPRLESGMPGSVKNLGLSLQRILDEKEAGDPGTKDQFADTLARPWFQSLARNEQLRVLAGYLRARNVRNFRHTQLEEVLKHLDKPEIEHTFVTAQCAWVLNAERIEAIPQRTRPQT